MWRSDVHICGDRFSKLLLREIFGRTLFQVPVLYFRKFNTISFSISFGSFGYGSVLPVITKPSFS